MMYHEPIDISDRMIRVPRETTPPFQTAEKPNGLSISSLLPPAAAGAGAAAAGAAAGAAASAAGAAAGALAAADAGASAKAGADTSADAAVTENRTAARVADKRVFLNMLPPKI